MRGKLRRLTEDGGGADVGVALRGLEGAVRHRLEVRVLALVLREGGGELGLGE